MGRRAPFVLAGILFLLGLSVAQDDAVRTKAQGPPAVASDLALSRVALTNKRPQQSPAETTQARANYQRLPLSFEPNQGQAGSDVQYLARGGHFNVFLTHDEVVFSFARRSARRRQLFDNADGDSEPPALSSIELRLEGASPTAAVSGVEALLGKANYLVGRDPKQWHLDLPTFAKVRYRNVYPGIDLLYYGNQGELESDFIIAPGANPEAVKLSVAGAEGMTIDASGDLILRMQDGALRLRKPLVYQESGSSRQQIAGNYVLAGQNQVGFRVAQYDHSRPLVIDPVLSYSTYLGGNGVDEATAIAMDSAGNAYITGDTTSTNFPVTGAPATGDMFVAKLDPNGAKVYATYVGGTAQLDFPTGIGVDVLGNAYVVGQTGETNLPTTAGALRTTYQGGTFDGFVFSLNAAGTGFNYFTYLGGSSFDLLTAVAVDSLGNAYITGQTSSGDYPIANPFETLASAGDGGIFTTTNSGTNWSASTTGLVDKNITVVAVNHPAPGATAVYAATLENGVIKSTNSGASWNPVNSGLTSPVIQALVVDPVTPANVYVGTGSGGVFSSTTGGTSWATMNAGLAGTNVHALAIDPTSPGTLYASTGRNGVFKFSAGSWSATGALPQDVATAIVVDPTNNQNLYVSFQNSGVYRSSNGGTSWAAFNSGLTSLQVAALAIDHGGHLYAGTRTGGVFLTTSGGNWAAINTGLPIAVFQALATDPTNNTTVYVGTWNGGVYRSANNGASWSEATNNGLNNVRISALVVDPQTPANLYAGSQNVEAVVTKLSASGGLVFSSYLGGGGGEAGLGIAIDGDNGNLYVAGFTNSLNFPTVAAAQVTMAGGASGFVSKVKSDGSGLVYSTYLGGPLTGSTGSLDQANAIAADSGGNAYVTGITNSTGFPVANATQATLAGTSNAFVARYNASGQKLFATYLGGEATDAGNAITVTANTDGSTSAWVAGQTTSQFFPLANPIQISRNGGSGASNAGFISDFDFPASGAAPTVVFSTFLGTGCGSSGCDTIAQAIGHDGTNNIYVAGRTMSNGFPVVNAVQSSLAGTQNAFIAKIGATANNADLSLTLNSFGPTTVVAGAAVNFSLTVTNHGPNDAPNVALGGRGGANLAIITCTATQGICGDNLQVLDKGFAELGTLASGASAAVTGVLRPLTPCGVAGVPACPFLIVVDARSDANDPSPANNSVSANLTVLAGADLGVTLSESPAAVQVGGTLTYTATATNLGPSPASNVTEVLTVSPAGAASFVSPPTGCTPSSNTLTCVIGPMNPGIPSVGELAVTVNSLPITATVTVSNIPEGDPNPANNTATVSTSSQERILLTDYNTSSLLVLDPSSNSLLQNVGAGTNAVGVAVSPNRRLAFVGNLNATYISVVDLTIGKEIRRIQGMRAARNLALTADGSLLVVPDLDKDDVAVIDTNSLQVLGRVALSNIVGATPGNIGVASVIVVGSVAFIDNYGSSSTGNSGLPIAAVDLVGLQANTVNGTFNGGFGLFSSTLAATPDGSTVVAIRQGPNTLWIINPATNSVAQTVNLPWPPYGVAVTPIGSDPTKIFGYIVHAGTAGGTAASVLDLRQGSATFGQILANTDVALPFAVNGTEVPMAVSRDGTRLAMASIASTSAANVAILDTGLMQTNPTTAVISSFHAGALPSSLRSLVYALADGQPPATAPTVTGFSSAAINNVPTAITINGTNFASGALVRIGKMDPIAATNVAPTSLSVVVPQNAPAQLGTDIIVTNPVPASGAASIDTQHQSGLLPGQFTIFAAPNFRPLNQVLNSNFGDATVSLLDLRNKVNSSVPVGRSPMGAAVTPDGQYAYVTHLAAATVEAIKLSTGSVVASIALPTGAIGGQSDSVGIAPNPATGTPVVYVLFRSSSLDLQVAMIDANAASGTFNTILRTLAAGINIGGNLPGGMAVTPDGKFVYGNDPSGRIVAFDVVGNTATALSTTTLGVSSFQPEPYITPDGNSLLLVGAPPNLTGPVDVFDISASHTNPTLVTSIAGTAPSGGVVPSFGAYRVAGTQLFAYDSSQQLVQAFAFDRAHSNFSQLGSYLIAGNPNEFFADLGVTPDGVLAYAQLHTDDAVAVLDAQALASGNANPLITKLATGLAPTALAISPTAVGEPDLLVGISSNPSAGVIAGGGFTYTVTVSNQRSTPATGVVFVTALAPSLTVNSVTPSQGACTVPSLPASIAGFPCSLGTISQSAPVTVTIVALAPASGLPCAGSSLGCIGAGASATENEIEFNPADNTAAVTTPILAAGATTCTGTTTNWLGGTGNWSDTTKWSTGVVPNSSSVNVCIDNGNPVVSQVTLDINASVGNLTIDANDSLIVSNNTALTVAGSISNSGQISVNAAGNNTFLQIAGGRNVSLSGGGTLTLSTSGNGTSIINQTSGGATLTNVDNTIQGRGQIGNNGLALVNQAAGTIKANVAATLLLNPNGITNAGALAATTGGTLQTTTTVNNAGGTISSTGSGSAVQFLNGTTVQGGTLNGSAGGVLGTAASNTATLDGTTQGALINAGTYTGANNSATVLRGTITNTGAIQVTAAGNNTFLQVAGGQNTSLAGGGTLTLSTSGNGAAIVNQTSGGSTLTNVDNTIQGQGEIGNNGLALVNQAGGTINANAGTLTVDATTVTNQHLMEATSGGTLAVNSTTVNNNASTILANGGTVQFTATTIQGGTLNTLNGGVLGTAPSQSVTLDGSPTHQGTLINTGTYTAPNNSTTILLGTINNTGAILLAATGNNTFLQIAGGQTTNLTGAGTVTMSTSGNGTPIINQTSGGGVLNNADNTIQGQGDIGNNGLALINSGTINANVSGKTLTIDATAPTNAGTLEATGGGILALSASTINNKSGIISADAAGSAVQFVNGVTLQSGTLSATNGGLLGTAASTSATLDGSTLGQQITLSGTYTAANNSSTILTGTINNTGSFLLSAAGNTTLLQIRGGQNVTLTGGGTVTMSTSGNGTPIINQTSGGSTLTNANNLIQGQGEIGNNGLKLANQAIINANVPGHTLTIDALTPTNTGTLQATGGGSLALNNSVVTNQGGTITVDGAASSVQFVNGATIQGGTLATTNGGLLGTAASTTITLDGSTHGALTNAGVFVGANNSSTILLGTINNTGAIQINAIGNTTLLQITGGQNVLLTGGGTLTMSTSGNGLPIINQTSGGSTLTNVNNLIQGQGQIGNNGLALINQAGGTINANVGGALLINAASVTNQHLLEATGGGTLQVNTTVIGLGGTIAGSGAGSSVQFLSGTSLQGGTLSTSGGAAMGTAASNSVTLDGSTANGAVVNTGTYTAANNSTTVVRGTINNTGAILVSAAGNTTLLQVAGGQNTTLTGSGAVTLSTSGNGTAIINQSSGGATLTNAGNTIQGQGQIGNNGLSVVNQATITANLSSAGSYTQTAGSIVIPIQTTDSVTSFVMSGGTAQVDGTLSASSGVTLSGTAILSGNGAVSGNLNSGGAIQPGDTPAPGIVTVSGGGTYTQSSAGTLDILIGGATLGTQYSQLNVVGPASLAGTLNVSSINGFSPVVGNSFTILTSTAISGTFANVGLPALSGGSWQVTYNPASVVLSVVSQGPSLTSLSPSSGLAGGSGFTLTVNGTNFAGGSSVSFNGNPRTTTFVSATQLTAAILAADVATAGTFNVIVTNPAPGGISNALTFTVNNPAPTIASLSPSSASVGSAPFTLTVNGANFVTTSTVNFNGSARTTTFVSATQLTAAILSSDMATAGTFNVTVTNPAPGGGTSNALSFTVNNPSPAITSLSPSSVNAGSGGFTLTVNGTGFVNTSAVDFNGSGRATTFVSSTQLTATILASDVTTAGNFNITVVNPTPGGGTSSPATFVVVALNPVPTITTLSPSSALVGGPAFTLTVNGTGFLSTSVVNFGGSARATTFVSATQLTAAMLASDIAAVGSVNVTVTNPAPGGGTSNAVPFAITAAADLAVAMTVSTPTVPVFGSVTYQITVTNNGPNPASGVTLTDILPANTVFASIDDLTDCAVSSGTLHCNFGALAVGSGAAKVVNLILVPLAVPAETGTFDNTAAVTANEFDPTTANNTATQTVQVTGTNLPGGGAFRTLPGLSANVLPGNDDDSAGPLPMNLNLNFFGLQVSTVFVNNNGNVTFNSALGTFTPFPLTSTSVPIIAAYFADVETDFPTSGQVTYGNDTVNARPAFGVNWPGVEYCCGSDPTRHNVFQLLLLDRSDVSAGDFDIEFNYDQIQWETGDASGGSGGLGGSPARVGYSNGSQTAGSFFELPGSGVSGSFLDTNTTSGLIFNSLNSTQPGRYVFQVRGGTVQSSADLAIGASGPQSATAGSTITYTLTATNLGPNAATGVTVTNTLPAGFSFVSAAPTGICSTAGQPVVVTCNVGSLANGSNAVITIRAAIPLGLSGPTTDIAVVSVPNNQDLNLGNNTATVLTNVAILPAVLSITKTHSGNFAQGQSGAAYTITVSNAAGAGATNGAVTVSDTVPSGLTATAIGGTGWTCPSLTSCNRVDSLAAGASYPPITLAADVAFNAPASVTNTATVSGGGAVNPASANDVATILPAAADLVPVIAIVPPPDASGTTISYAITVTNNGPSSATQVQLTNQLVGNAGFVSASSPTMTCPAPAANSLACTVAVLNNGASALVNITVNLTGPGWDSNTVQVSSQVPDSNPSNNVASVQKVSAGGNTVTGSEVAVQPVDGTTGASPAILTFASVTRGGTTSVSSASSGPAPASGFRTGTPAVFYNLATTAGYSGAISVALGFNGVSFHHPANVRLFHSENGAWVDRTVAINPAGGYAVAQVTSLSPFALFEPINHVPDAKLGADLTTAATSAQGAKVTLNGSASIDADHDPLTYRWTGPFPEGNGVATGVSPTVTMPAGANTVTLMVNDGEADSKPAQQIITVTDFGVAAAAGGPTTISAGGSAKFNVTASQQFGPFASAVALACLGLPQGTQCSFSPNSVNAGGAASTLTISTTARTAALLAPVPHKNRAPLYALWMPLPGIVMLGLGARRRARKRTAALLLLLLIGLMMLLVSCGGGGAGITPQPQQFSTPAGTYTVTVMGTANGTLQHTTTVTFTVQ